MDDELTIKDPKRFNPWPYLQEHMGNLIANDVISGDINDTEIALMLSRIEAEWGKSLEEAFDAGVKYANIRQARTAIGKAATKATYVCRR